MNNLKEIHSYINKDFYCNHPGKIASVPYLQNANDENCNIIKSTVAEHGFVILNCKGKQLLAIIRMLQNLFGKQLKDVGIRKNLALGVFALNCIISRHSWIEPFETSQVQHQSLK